MNRKLVMAAVLPLLMSACATAPRTVPTLSLSMIALNQGHPFVSPDFAERLALLVLEQKYPKDIFVARGPGRLVEKEGMWLATFDNDLVGPDDQGMLPMIGGKLVPRQLTVVIRETNGEIVAIT